MPILFRIVIFLADGPSPLRLVGIGFELVAPLLVGLFGGQWLDRRFGTAPWLLFCGAILGSAAGDVERVPADRSAGGNGIRGIEVRSRPIIGFALGASATAAGSAAVLAWWLAGRDEAVASWATIGFLVMAVPGIAGGTWLVGEHGRAGSRFLVALPAGFVSRLVLAAVAAFGAAKAGGDAGLGLIF